MAENSAIEWTEATFNPWWGCTKVSPACDNCYAERDAHRYLPTKTLWGVTAERREFGDNHWNEPLRWNRRAAAAGKRMRVFCASMADVFDKDAPPGARERLWGLIAATPALDWQLLTKRIGNAARMVPAPWMDGAWPANAWIGASVVTQEEVDRDVPKLLALPARVRFLSCEPMLGPLDLSVVKDTMNDLRYSPLTGEPVSGWRAGFPPPLPRRGLAWVIAGGESGPKARPMHPDWPRGLRDQCAAAGVPFLLKQHGEWASVSEVAGVGEHHRFPNGATVRRVGKKAAGRTLDGTTHDGYPL